jgi:hypothetical protein
MSKGPARGYSWKQAEKGNVLAQKHGAYSDRVTDPDQKALVKFVIQEVGYLADPSYEPAVCAWARHEARVLALSAYLDKHGPLDADGVPRPALAALKDFERLAASARTRLGLDPLSRAQLGRDVTATKVDLARLMSEYEDESDTDR